MKKVLTCLILIFFLISNNAFAISELYCIKNTTKADLMPKIETIFNENSYNINKKDPYYAVSSKNNTNIVIILQKNYSDVYYYFETNKKNNLNKNFIKLLKKNKINYEKIENATYLDSFAKLSLKVKPVVSQINVQTQQTTQPQATTYDSQKLLKGYVGQVAKGTSFSAYLQNTLNTASAVNGENVIAVLTNDWKYNGQTIAPQGSLVFGTITKAQPARYGYQNGAVQITFNQVQALNGKTYNIEAEKIDFQVDSEGKAMDITKKAGGGAAVGALIGLLASSSSSHGSATLIGAGIGLAAGLVMLAMEKGTDAEIPAFTEIDLILLKPLDVIFNY